jgi:hypothetical protein
VDIPLFFFLLFAKTQERQSWELCSVVKCLPSRRNLPVWGSGLDYIASIYPVKGIGVSISKLVPIFLFAILHAFPWHYQLFCVTFLPILSI